MQNFFRFHAASSKDDVLSGLTVALALVPEAVAFAFLAGVSPLIGLYSAFIICFVTAIVGGRPGMISGATGAMAVVIVSLVAIHGIEYLFPTVLLCGLLQIGVGCARLGMLIRMVPHSVMLGFVNGLAIVIGLAQLGSFKTLNLDSGQLVYLSGIPLWTMLGLVALTMAIIWLLPKLTQAVPASLVAILTVTFLSVGINRWSPATAAPEGQQNLVATVGDMLLTNARASAAADVFGPTPEHAAPGLLDTAAAAGAAANQLSLVSQNTGSAEPADSAPVAVPAPNADQTLIAQRISEAMAGVDETAVGISGGLPVPFFMEFALPPLSLQTLWIIFPFALTLAGVGLIESLMTMSLIDEITETRGRGNRECIGQGVANMFCGFFGGMGGCAMIGQSLINVNSGGRGRLSGITAAVCLLLFVLLLAPLIEQIPMAALAGVMFMVVIGTFEWASLKMFKRVPPSDMVVMVLVAGYTVVMHDLATAVILGVIVSALVFAWKHATHIGADIQINEHGSKIYQLHGPLFFASVSSFGEIFDPKSDPNDVVIDFYYTRVYDQSGVVAINSLAERYEQYGKRLHLTHLSDECRRLLDKAGDMVEVNYSEDPQYHIATDRLG